MVYEIRHTVLIIYYLDKTSISINLILLIFFNQKHLLIIDFNFNFLFIQFIFKQTNIVKHALHCMITQRQTIGVTGTPSLCCSG